MEAQQQQPTYLMSHPSPQNKGRYPSSEATGIISQVNSVNTRLRLLEERFTNLRRKTQLTEQNMLNNRKKSSTEFKTISGEINDLKHTLREINENITQIVDELPRFAKKDELKTLTTYVNLWDMSRFMSREEAERLIKRCIGKEKV